MPRISACVRIEFSVEAAEEHRREHRERRAPPTPMTRSVRRFEASMRHAALPKSPCGRNASTSAISDEREDHRVLRAAIVCRPSAGRRRRTRRRARTSTDPTAAPASEPIPPMITTTSENRSHSPSRPCAIDACEPPTVAPNAASADADEERDRERRLDVDPERRRHLIGRRHRRGSPCRSSCDGARARARARRRRRERASSGAPASSSTPATWRSTKRLVQPGQRDAHGVAAEPLRAERNGAWEVRDDLVGDDHRDGDRDERLPKILALVPAQKQLLHGRDRRARCMPIATSNGTTHSSVFTSLGLEPEVRSPSSAAGSRTRCSHRGGRRRRAPCSRPA